LFPSVLSDKYQDNTDTSIISLFQSVLHTRSLSFFELNDFCSLYNIVKQETNESVTQRIMKNSFKPDKYMTKYEIKGADGASDTCFTLLSQNLRLLFTFCNKLLLTTGYFILFMFRRNRVRSSEAC